MKTITNRNLVLSATSVSVLYALWKTCQGIIIRRKLPRFPGYYYPLFGNYDYAIRGDTHAELELLKAQREHNSDAITISEPGLNTYVVILTDIGLIRECFVKNAAHTSARLYSLMERMNIFAERFWTPQYTVFGSSGQIWQSNRKRVLSAFRELGVGKNRLEELINIETEYMVEAIAKKAPSNKDDLSYIFATAVTNIICQLCIGRRFPYDSSEFQALYKSIRVILDRNKFSSFQELLPSWMRRLPGIKNQDVEDFIENVKPVLEFARRERTFQLNKFLKNSANYEMNQEECLLKSLIKHFHNEPNPLAEDITLSIIMDMFIAGTDTTTNTLLWAVYYLRNHQGIQQQLKKEIMENISVDHIEYGDIEKLPLCHAFLLETWRFSAIAPYAIPHLVTNDFSAGTYTFPKGTILMPSLICANRDAKIYNNPDEFDINNFLRAGKVVSPEVFANFGIGPRVCVGEKIARIEAFVLTANIIKKISFQPKNAIEIDDDDDAFVGIIRSPYNFEFVMDMN